MHVHSGETQYFKTTNPNRIKLFVDNVEGHKLIFTTYHSLHRVQESGIDVDTIYFDEHTIVYNVTSILLLHTLRLWVVTGAISLLLVVLVLLLPNQE